MPKEIAQYKEGKVKRWPGYFGTICPFKSCLHVQVTCLHTGAEDHRASKDRDIRCTKCSRMYCIKREV